MRVLLANIRLGLSEGFQPGSVFDNKMVVELFHEEPGGFVRDSIEAADNGCSSGVAECAVEAVNAASGKSLPKRGITRATSDDS